MHAASLSTNSFKFSVTTQSSASTTLKYFPLTCSTPVLIAEPCPPFVLFTMTKVSRYQSTNFCATSTLLSGVPSFTTITSSLSSIALSISISSKRPSVAILQLCCAVCASVSLHTRNDDSPLFRNFSALYVGIMIDNILLINCSIRPDYYY